MTWIRCDGRLARCRRRGARPRAVQAARCTLLAIVDKRRDRPGESEVMNIIGEVDGKDCLLIDDIVDSGGTLCNAAEALLNNGAKSVTAYITHGVLVRRRGRPCRLEAQGTGHHRLDPADPGSFGAQHPRDFDGQR
jgi:orotate phosphoribosyltransferase